MPYLGIYSSKRECIRCVEIAEGQVELAHLKLFMDIIDNSDLTLITSDRKPTQKMVRRTKS